MIEKSFIPSLVIRLAVTALVTCAFLAVIPPQEVQAQGKKGKSSPAGPRGQADESVTEDGNPDFVSRAEIGSAVLRGIRFHGVQDAGPLGMIRTGLTAKFEGAVYCRTVDDYWGQDYSRQMGGDHVHGGIDIPVPLGTPVHAIADGEVVQMSLHENSPDGIQIWLRHAPADTGLPMWTFSQFAHLRELPNLKYGDRVTKGQVVGITSNTGTSGPRYVRRPGIHFAIISNDTGKYYRDADFIFPLDGRWTDPHAIYRGGPEFDSTAMKALPAEQKQIRIPYMMLDGSFVPAETKLIWPYPCSERPLPETRRNPPG